MCRGCHGIAHYRIAFPEVYSVPKLDRQLGGHIVRALQEYRAGHRGNATMRSIAGTECKAQSWGRWPREFKVPHSYVAGERLVSSCEMAMHRLRIDPLLDPNLLYRL